MENPLDQFATTTPGSNDLKVPPLPKLEELVRDSGLVAGVKAFDEKMEEWRQNLERNINTRLAAQPDTPELS